MTELTDASVTIRPTDVVLKFGVDDDLPDTGHWTLSTTFTAGPDGPIDHVGFKMTDGRPTGGWSFDLSGGDGQRNYSQMPSRNDRTWTLVMPRDAVRSDSGEWRAALDVNGRDAGTVSGTY